MNPQPNYDAKRAKLIQMIHIAANELGILDPKCHASYPDDDYHRLLATWNRPGTRQRVTSSTQMSTAQLSELYRDLKRRGFRVKSKEPVSQRRKGRKGRQKGDWRKYPSTLDGLKTEICDLAKQRFGQGPETEKGWWEFPLNNFCRRFGIDKWQWLDVSHGKAVKDALLRLESQKPSTAENAESAEESGVPF